MGVLSPVRTCRKKPSLTLTVETDRRRKKQQNNTNH